MPRTQSPHRIGSAGTKSTGPVTRERVHARAHELAVIAGRTPPHVAQIDYEQAKREVTGESDLERQESMLDSGAGQS